MRPKRDLHRAGLGRVDAVSDHVADDEHNNVRREIVRAMMVERHPAMAAALRDLEIAPEEPALATGRTTADQASPDRYEPTRLRVSHGRVCHLAHRGFT